MRTQRAQLKGLSSSHLTTRRAALGRRIIPPATRVALRARRNSRRECSLAWEATCAAPKAWSYDGGESSRGDTNLQRAAPPWGFSERSPSHWIDTGEVPGREGAARSDIGISSRSSKPAMAWHRCLAPWAATHGCVGSAPGRRMKAGNSPSYYVSYPPRSLNAASRNRGRPRTLRGGSPPGRRLGRWRRALAALCGGW
jgi:hypothetical protein